MRRIILTSIALAVLPALAAAEPPVATVGGHPITRAQLDEHVKPKLMEIENQRYEAMREGLDELIAAELLQQEAKARNISIDELGKKEIDDKIVPPTDAEIQQLYDDNKEQLGNEPLEAVKPRIIEYLKQQKADARRQEFIDQLRAKYKTTVALQGPVVKVSTGGRPARGGAQAPVTIIAFSDYECPFCKRESGVVEQVLTTYGDKVRLVYRDFPLPFHAHARPAAEAARCAEAQGKFWEYHAKLLASEDLGEDKLKEMAGAVGLDRTKFDECLAKQEFKAAIDQDIADGGSVGVSGTPAFFVNGHMLSGAQPFEKFKEVIDDELTRAKSAKPS